MASQADSELDKVMRRGRRVFQPGFVLYYAPIRVVAKPRIVVSQKVDKRSVVRHKVKRRIRHILSHSSFGNMGVVIITNQEILKQSFAQLSSSIRRATQSLS
jgi:ribonuclease P protein component